MEILAPSALQWWCHQALPEFPLWRIVRGCHPIAQQKAPLPPPLGAYLRLTLTSGVRLEERRHPGERDLAVELLVCRAHGRSLLGATPAELIGEVPDR